MSTVQIRPSSSSSLHPTVSPGAGFEGGATATLLRLLHAHLRKRLREQLRQFGARELLCRRAIEAGVGDAFYTQALNAPLEALIAKAWAWYEPLMFSRCLAGFELTYGLPIGHFCACGSLTQQVSLQNGVCF